MYVLLTPQGLAFNCNHFYAATLQDNWELRKLLTKHENLIKYADNLKHEFLDTSLSSSVPRSPLDPSVSSTPRGWSSDRKLNIQIVDYFSHY